MIRGYTSIEQSEKLAEILPFESADMYYNLGESNIPNFIHGSHSDFRCYTMCWSLAALLSILDFPCMAQTDENEWELSVFDHYNDGYIEKTAGNPIDACYELVLKLHELNLL